MARLATLCWCYQGGREADLAVESAITLHSRDLADDLRGITRLVVYLARYMRQSAEWVLGLTVQEAREYQEVVSEMIRDENHSPEDG